MTTEQAVAESKAIRKELDDVLQRMKGHKDVLMIHETGSWHLKAANPSEVLANHTISIRAVEDAVMRQGMVLKNIGATPNPYPHSYDPASPVVEPTADGLKL